MVDRDRERDRLAARAGRVAQLGANFAGAAAAFGAARLFGGDAADEQIARAMKEALGRSKGPLMKVAQMMATIPDFLPPEYAAQLSELQTNAPSMGPGFVERRMRAELGPDWRRKFQDFDLKAVAAASLGQVHKATGLDGALYACKLQYPDMASAVESDLSHLQALFGLVKRMGRIIDPTEIGMEIADRLREELDYTREAAHLRLYRQVLSPRADICVPAPVEDLSTSRLLTMHWIEGASLKKFLDAPQDTRDRLAELLFRAWWFPMGSHGLIHGDPHLGNYTFAENGGRLNLLDFGCVRVFPARFVAGVIRLREALMADDFDAAAGAYFDWGFQNLTKAQIEALNVWAKFIYGPLLDDRVREAADGVKPAEYGRKEALRMKEMLLAAGPVAAPREFVFMDRAAIGLGAAFLHLRARLNFRRLFEEAIEHFDEAAVAARQKEALIAAGIAA